MFLFTKKRQYVLSKFRQKVTSVVVVVVVVLDDVVIVVVSVVVKIYKMTFNLEDQWVSVRKSLSNNNNVRIMFATFRGTNKIF